MNDVLGSDDGQLPWSLFILLDSRQQNQRPTTQTAMASLCRSDVIQKNRICTTCKGYDRQQLSLWLSLSGYQVLRVLFHR